MEKNSSNILLRGTWETSASITKYINGVKTIINTKPKILKLHEKKLKYKEAFYNDSYKKSLIDNKTNKNDIFLTRNKSAYSGRKKSNFYTPNLKINKIHLKLFNFNIIKNRTETEKIFNIRDIEKEFEARYKFLKRFTNYFQTSDSNNNETVKNVKKQKISKSTSDLSNNIQILNKSNKKMKHFLPINTTSTNQKKILETNCIDNDNNKEENDINDLLIKNDSNINNSKKPIRSASAVNLKSRKNMLNFQVLGNSNNNQNNITYIPLAEIRQQNNIIIKNRIKEVFESINRNKINNNIISPQEINNFLNISQIPINLMIKNKTIKTKIKCNKKAEKFHSVDEIIYKNADSLANTERVNNISLNNNNSHFINNNHSCCHIKNSNKIFEKVCYANVNFFELEKDNSDINKTSRGLLKKKKNEVNKFANKFNYSDLKYNNDKHYVNNFNSTKQFMKYNKKNYPQVIVMDK